MTENPNPGADSRQHQQPGSEMAMQPKPVAIRDYYRGSDKLKGKVALISGGDSGIGRAVALHFAREGADISILYLEEDADADETRRAIEQEGRRCLLNRGDYRSADFCRAVVDRTIDEFGRLDVLVNNAGEQHPSDDIGKITQKQLYDTFETNIFGFFYLTQAALKYLKAGAAIINTSSVTAFRGSKKLIDYASTKGAIQSFTFSLAQALAEDNIRVNGVAPGPIWTPLIPSTFSAEQLEKFGKNTLMARPGQPAEVAPAYVFLASEDASYITGQFIHVNGGGFIAA